MGISAYPKILQLGGSGTQDLLSDEVVVQEKTDGSQFSLMVAPDGFEYRSKGHLIDINNCENLFKPTIAHFESIKHKSKTMQVGVVLRGEAFASKKHNTLNYGRCPKGNFVLFDVTWPDGEYTVRRAELEEFAEIIETDVTPEFYRGLLTYDELNNMKGAWLETTSLLGGCKIEGVVIKNYHKLIEINGTVRPIFCKLVSAEFKELHRGNKEYTPSKGKLESFAETFKTEARWIKAIQHLREAGQLIDDPKDIAALLKEINQDILSEEKEYIKETLLNIFWKDISRAATNGFPEWYKQRLLANVIEKANATK
jgi:hypothetical protein